MNTSQSTLSSPRNQRILFWLGLLALAAGIVVLILKFAGGSDPTPVAPSKGFKPTLPAKQVVLKDADGAPITTYSQFDPAIRDTIRRFVLGAVAEHDYADSWNVLAANFKRGYTAKTWTTSGSHPIVPFPVYKYETSQFTVRQATTKEILVAIKVRPVPTSSEHVTDFQIGLIPGKGGKWLVNYWGPLGSNVPVPYGGDG